MSMGRSVDAREWLGLENVDAERWRLHVHSGLVSGATALFGGCATAAALAVAREATTQPLVWASSHFEALAKLGSDVLLTCRVVSAGRTMTHVEVKASVDERESFVVRIAAGARPAHPTEGQWVEAPDVEPPESCRPFLHPVHGNTWAERFDWRLAGRGVHPASPWVAWWVRPAAGEDVDPIVLLPVLADYVTYGVGRALGEPMGGLSIDNVLRFHRWEAARSAEWLLVEVRPEGIEAGFGTGTARVFAGGVLAATGSQSMVMNTWDWRLPEERTAGEGGSSSG